MSVAIALPEVGVEEVDTQHQNLLRLVQRLGEAMDEGRPRRTLLRVFEEMVAYAEEHFATEERHMAEFAFEELDEHRREHQRFVRKVAYFRRILTVETPEVDRDVVGALELWLVQHVKEVDRRYAGCFVANGLR